jgi:hypothetical protein
MRDPAHVKRAGAGPSSKETHGQKSQDDHLKQLAGKLRTIYTMFDPGMFLENCEQIGSVERQFLDVLSKPATGELGEVDEIFRNEGTERALEFCMNAQIWDIAVILAGTISMEEFTRVSGEVLTRRMGSGSFLSSSLRVADGKADFVKDWKAILVNALQNYTEENVQMLRETKTLLEVDGLVDAAEIVGVFLPREDD